MRVGTRVRPTTLVSGWVNPPRPTDLGAPVRNGSTTPKDLIGVNIDTGAGTASGVTFVQPDPNGGLWAALYDGVDDRISLSTRFVLGAAFSLSCWVKTTSTDASSGYAGNPANVMFGDHTNSIESGFGIHDGKWEARRFNGSIWQTVTHPSAVNDGQWHHCALSSVGGVVLMYVDRILYTGSVTTGTWGAIDTIGAGYLNGSGYGDHYDGSLYLPTLYQNWLWKPHPIS